MTDIWALTVMTFKGTVPGAVHAYGVLCGPDNRNYKIAEVLDKKAADELNEHAERVGKDWLTYTPNEPCEFFMREEDLEEAARVAFLFLSRPGSALFRGTSVSDVSLNPSKPLAGPQEAVDALRPIWDLDESLGDYDPKREDCWDDWKRLLQEFGLVSDSSYSRLENWVAEVNRYPWSETESSPCGYRASVMIEPR